MSLLREMSFIATLLAFTTYSVYGCIPFDYNTIAQNLALRSHYAFGESTLKSQPISISNVLTEKRPIEVSSDLFCYDFDSSCRWHNVDDLMMIGDDLNWYHGNGHLDRNRLQVSTGTYVTPDGTYGIVATDRIRAPSSKATLISDVITCQVGPGELRFMYWISPEVRLTVCLKRVSQLYPDFCTSPIRDGSPGPAEINIHDFRNEPFQILIQADNFIFHSANLEGGFAIVDNLEYHGDLCSATSMLPINTQKEDFIVSQVMHDEIEPKKIVMMKSNFTIYKPVCTVLQCNFDEKYDRCGIDISNSLWSVMSSSLDKIRLGNNISKMFYSSAGSFIYVAGPITKTRLYTESFQSTIDFNLLFTYYKTSNSSKLRIIAKINGEPMERTIFTNPIQKKETKRWYRELISLQAGIYDYVAIETQNLGNDEYIGIDEFMVLDSQKRPVCSQQESS